jgi:hypothetical protein
LRSSVEKFYSNFVIYFVQTQGEIRFKMCGRHGCSRFAHRRHADGSRPIDRSPDHRVHAVQHRSGRRRVSMLHLRQNSFGDGVAVAGHVDGRQDQVRHGCVRQRAFNTTRAKEVRDFRLQAHPWAAHVWLQVLHRREGEQAPLLRRVRYQLGVKRARVERRRRTRALPSNLLRAPFSSDCRGGRDDRGRCERLRAYAKAFQDGQWRRRNSAADDEYYHQAGTSKW